MTGRFGTFVRGGWVFDAPETAEWVWGTGDTGLWIRGEPFWVVGVIGVGKTTLMQQVALHGLGIRSGPLLDMPVSVKGRVIYLAADRPRQIQRSFRRMVSVDDLELLDKGLAVHIGAPSVRFDDPSLKPTWLRDWLMEPWEDDDGRVVQGAREGDLVIFDSAKDFLAKPSDETAGTNLKRLLEPVTDAGIEVCLGHHLRKRPRGDKQDFTLDDMYGSQLFAAGAGSVVILDGVPGGAEVKLTHAKQPIESVGPLKLHHDHKAGRTSLVGGFTAESQEARHEARVSDHMLEATKVARAQYEKDPETPIPSQRALLTLMTTAGRDVDKITGIQAAQAEADAGREGLKWAIGPRSAVLYWYSPGGEE